MNPNTTNESQDEPSIVLSGNRSGYHNTKIKTREDM